MKKAILALFVGLMFIAAPLFVKADTVTTPVSISAYFDETNSDVSSIIPPQTYGSKVSFSNHLPTAPEGYESYEFAYWIVNGVVRSDLNFNAQFRVTDHLDLVAIYRPANKYVVVFMDTNGKMIDLDYVSSGSPATAPNIDNLTKPGLVVQSLNPWSVDFSEVTNNMVVWVQYESAQEVTFDVSTTNGTGGGTGLEFGSVASVSASETSGSDVFTHWVDENGKVVSYQLSHTFTVYKDTVLTAVYGESASHLPSVVISDRMSFHSNKSSYIGQFYVAEGYELVEYGMITSMVQGSFDLETEGITRYQSNKHNGPTKEFMMSISAATSQYIRGYLVVEDDLEQLHYFYSSIEKTRDLMFSEYGEGSSNNKWYELYNPTEESIDLSDYAIKTYYNGSETEGNSLTFSPDTLLNPGEVFVVANSSSNETIQALKNITDGTANFNGDDALVLFKGSLVVDIIGKIGQDPGTSWDGITADRTLTRNVFSPNPLWNHLEWNVFNIDTFDYIGFHNSDPTPKAIIISGETIVDVEMSITLSAMVLPSSSSQEVTWSSSNTAIASVDEDGVVLGVSAGQVSITARSVVDTNISQSFTVVVSEEAYSPTVIISQAYGGGGNSGSVYTHDFVELFNSTSETISLDGWVLYYASATGSTWTATTLSGSIAPGRYYLIQMAKGSGGTTALPTPDKIGTVAMSGTAFKIALCSKTTSVPTGAGPIDLTTEGLVDFVGAGTANQYEGSGKAPAPSNSNSVIRKGGDSPIDTNDNSNDFIAQAANPRNSSYVPSS